MEMALTEFVKQRLLSNIVIGILVAIIWSIVEIYIGSFNVWISVIYLLAIPFVTNVVDYLRIKMVGN